LTTLSVKDRGMINPRYAKRIIIWHDITDRGQSQFQILHKKSYFHNPTMEGVPQKYRVRKTFKGAEDAAIHLLLNYTKYF